jgi:hypothetical protein
MLLDVAVDIVAILGFLEAWIELSCQRLYPTTTSHASIVRLVPPKSGSIFKTPVGLHIFLPVPSWLPLLWKGCRQLQPCPDLAFQTPRRCP